MHCAAIFTSSTLINSLNLKTLQSWWQLGDIDYHDATAKTLVYINQGKASPSCFESIAGLCICLLCWGKSIGNHSMSEWIWEIYLDIFNRKVNSATSVLIRLVSVCLSFSYGSEMLHNRSRSRNGHQVRDLSRGVLLRYWRSIFITTSLSYVQTVLQLVFSHIWHRQPWPLSLELKGMLWEYYTTLRSTL